MIWNDERQDNENERISRLGQMTRLKGQGPALSTHSQLNAPFPFLAGRARIASSTERRYLRIDRES
jgi:hypothetical protein